MMASARRLSSLQRALVVRVPISVVGALVLVLSGLGCSGGEERAAPEQPTGPGSIDPCPENSSESDDEEPAPREAHIGTVRGVVRLAPDVELPSFTEEEYFGREGMIEPWRGDCSPATIADRHGVRLGAQRGLEGVIISASGDADTFFDALPERSPQTHQVSIEDCRLTPRSLDVTVGDKLVLTQRTEGQGFFPIIGGGNVMDILPAGDSREYEIDFQGAGVLSCGVATSCGRMDVVAHYHPVHTRTDADGHFELSNVPAGQGVVLHAWHPLYDYVSSTVLVEEGGEQRIELTLRPRTPPVEEGDAPTDVDSDSEPPEVF